MSEPVAIIFFNNGMAAVFDQHGEQMGKYQGGVHKDVIAALEADGYNWRELVADGRPLERHEFRDNLGRPM
jgi:hypothetical protein